MLENKKEVEVKAVEADTKTNGEKLFESFFEAVILKPVMDSVLQPK